MQNYFDIFELKVDYKIDQELLEQNYFKLLQKYHPDKFSKEEDKKIAYQNTMYINKAYETLESSLYRAEYMMYLRDVILGTENDSIKPSQDILFTMLEAREKLENTNDPKTLQNFLSDSINKYQQLANSFNQFYTTNKIEEAANTAISMRYQNKLITETENKLNNL